MAPSKTACVVSLDQNRGYQRLIDGTEQSCGMKAGRVFLEPGQACGQHSTDQKEETLVFLAGRGHVEIGSAPHLLPVAQGQIAYIPPHTLHNVKNTGQEPLVYIFCVAPVA